MEQDIRLFLIKKRRALERSEKVSDKFALPAFQRLLGSRACMTGDLGALRTLAGDLKEENGATIRVARTHPDIFHPYVIRSRQTENHIYDTVIRLIERRRSEQPLAA